MKNNKSTVKKCGFSIIECLFSIFIIINIFVLSTQLIYNIYINSKLEDDSLWYENFAFRIETHFKEVTDYEISPNNLIYQYRNEKYHYYVINNQLVYQFVGNIYPLINNVRAISFNLEGHILYISITTTKNDIYETQVIIYGKK